jgi:hypothetical protein
MERPALFRAIVDIRAVFKHEAKHSDIRRGGSHDLRDRRVFFARSNIWVGAAAKDGFEIVGVAAPALANREYDCLPIWQMRVQCGGVFYIGEAFQESGGGADVECVVKFGDGHVV